MMIKRVSFLLICALTILACTTKDNKINIINSDLYPISGSVNSFTDYYSFRDEVSVNGENYKLLVSNTEEVESQALLSFAYLPKDLFSVSNATLTIYSDLKPGGEMVFQVKEVLQDYLEGEANWEEARKGTIWDPEKIITTGIEPVTHIDTIGTKLDSLHFNIPGEEILAWAEKELSLYSLLIYTESDNYIELFSSESAKVPVLKFNYTTTTSNEVKEYKRNCFKDTYLVNDKQDLNLTWDNLEYSNMLPRKSFLKFEIDSDNLTNEEGEPLTEFQFKHLTVNKAYLRLYLKDHSFFTGKRNSYLSAYRVISPVEEHVPLETSDLEYLVNTGTSTKVFSAEADTTQFIDVKITPLIQGFISGKKENHGIVLKSAYQSTNFDSMQFYTPDAAEEALRPKIYFIYTLPLD